MWIDDFDGPAGTPPSPQFWSAECRREHAGIKVSPGSGVWPAFWLLGTDIDPVHWHPAAPNATGG